MATNENKPIFGRHLRPDFLLESKYVPLNHGSFGTYPRSIHKKFREFQDKVEEHPDRFNRIEVNPLLRKNREQIAEIINCPDPSDVAFVHNASMGMATVLRSFPFEKGDKVIHFNSTYVNVNATLRYLKDIGQIELVTVDIKYPLSDGEVLDIIRATIQQHNQEGKIRMAVLDAIIALPGVLFPYEAASRLVQEHGILSLIDAAHAAGQIPIDVSSFDPDFLVSNLHKWFYTPRGSCILYAPKRNQRFLHPLALEHNYTSEGNGFEQEFWNYGAHDHCTFLCVGPAIEYRKSLGGEDAIREYCHNLAVEGGNLVAERLGTQVMDNQDHTLIGSMVNVEIPLYPKTLRDDEVTTQFINKIIYEQNCMTPAFKHNGKWWVRLSAQIYNDITDFEYGAKAIEKVCQDLSI
ncbi:pyridoxal phosphate-dependent transferase [Phascolomyces articulosus]|uniref:Pyridoxal phosphate-dependent transferase n=1 Tax=Phascolomyces articulosus TaxID=60185 RepID=A0AAD5K825_9FUNG|nr:pyridoxal phosphate-dependent transferase [Phascolomyces articulosus]